MRGNLSPATAALADQIRYIESSVISDAAGVVINQVRAWKRGDCAPAWEAVANMLNHPVLRLAILRAALAVSTGEPADEPVTKSCGRVDGHAGRVPRAATATPIGSKGDRPPCVGKGAVGTQARPARYPHRPDAGSPTGATANG